MCSTAITTAVNSHQYFRNWLEAAVELKQKCQLIIIMCISLRLENKPTSQNNSNKCNSCTGWRRLEISYCLTRKKVKLILKTNNTSRWSKNLVLKSIDMESWRVSPRLSIISILLRRRISNRITKTMSCTTISYWESAEANLNLTKSRGKGIKGSI